MQAVFVYNSSYDMILLPNGTILTVNPQIFWDYAGAEATGADFSAWNGERFWAESGYSQDSLLHAANMRGEIVAYYSGDGKLTLVNPARWAERQEYYKQD